MIYKQGFFIATGLWITAPTMYMQGEGRTIPGWLFGGLLAIVVVLGVLWWRENRRVMAIIYPTVGTVDLSVLPLINPLSLRAGLQTFALRWIIVCISSLVIIFMLLEFSISSWLLSNSGSLYLFTFGLFAYAALVAFYILGSTKQVDVHHLVQQFAEGNSFQYTVPAPNHGVARLRAMLSPTTTENWRMSGQYRQRNIEIILNSMGNGRDYEPVFELRLAGIGAGIMTGHEAVQEKLRVLDSVLDDTNPQAYIIFAQFNEGAYSQAGMSRLFASLDVVIDQIR